MENHKNESNQPFQMQLFEMNTNGGYTYYQSGPPVTSNPIVTSSVNITYQVKEEKRKMSHSSLSSLISGLHDTLSDVTDVLETIETNKAELEDAETDLQTLQEELQNIIDSVENLSSVSVYLDSVDFSVDF